MNQDLRAYYDERANEYDNIYLNPKEQKDLAEATKIIQRLFLERSVVEFACGTGYNFSWALGWRSGFWSKVCAFGKIKLVILAEEDHDAAYHARYT